MKFQLGCLALLAAMTAVLPNANAALPEEKLPEYLHRHMNRALSRPTLPLNSVRAIPEWEEAESVVTSWPNAALINILGNTSLTFLPRLREAVCNSILKRKTLKGQNGRFLVTLSTQK